MQVPLSVHEIVNRFGIKLTWTEEADEGEARVGGRGNRPLSESKDSQFRGGRYGSSTLSFSRSEARLVSVDIIERLTKSRRNTENAHTHTQPPSNQWEEDFEKSLFVAKKRTTMKIRFSGSMSPSTSPVVYRKLYRYPLYLLNNKHQRFLFFNVLGKQWYFAKSYSISLFVWSLVLLFHGQYWFVISAYFFSFLILLNWFDQFYLSQSIALYLLFSHQSTAKTISCLFHLILSKIIYMWII